MSRSMADGGHARMWKRVKLTRWNSRVGVADMTRVMRA